MLHKGKVGEIYNVGGCNELSNLDVAKTIIKLLGLEAKQDVLLSFVEDRHFNDLRYTIDCTKLKGLGWVEEKNWEEGLKETIEWYKEYSSRYGNIDSALVAHPRQGANTND